MKKTAYITPAIRVKKITISRMLATSPMPIIEDTITGSEEGLETAIRTTDEDNFFEDW